MMIRYAAYYRKHHRTSLASVATIHAPDIRVATELARDAIGEAYAGKAVLLHVFVARESPWPVKNDAGELVAPSMV
jgi:1,2-phenylacetyl-CoA epoxidase PaaB subunit